MSTLGDQNQSTALHAFNAKSLWTDELEALLLDGTLDLIVHSLKDLPTQIPAGCCVSSVLERGDRRDVLVVRAGAGAGAGAGRAAGLGALREGAVVGTSSVRRAALVKRAWPALRCRDVRGNVGTRLRKLDEGAGGAGDAHTFDCVVLAAAGVQRLGLGARIGGFLGGGGWMGAVGQGALGVEWRVGDARVEGLVEALVVDRVEWECVAERSLLRTLEGGCSVPVGVETEWAEGEGEEEEARDKGEAGGKAGWLVIRAVVVSLDGRDAVEGERRHWVGSKREADECGWLMARELVEKGAGAILEKIALNRAVLQRQDGA